MTRDESRTSRSATARWLLRASLAARLLGRFATELAIANLQQARLVLSRPREVRPRWVHYRSRLQSETSRTVLGALISLTPGTLTCDLRGDNLLIHALDATSDEEAVARIRRRFEDLLARMEAA